MYHYKQIIINMSVADDLPEKELEELADKIQQFVKKEMEKKQIETTDITTRVN